MHALYRARKEDLALKNSASGIVEVRVGGTLSPV